MHMDILWIKGTDYGTYNARFNRRKLAFNNIHEVFYYAKERKLKVMYEN